MLRIVDKSFENPVRMNLFKAIIKAYKQDVMHAIFVELSFSFIIAGSTPIFEANLNFVDFRCGGFCLLSSARHAH